MPQSAMDNLNAALAQAPGLHSILAGAGGQDPLTAMLMVGLRTGGMQGYMQMLQQLGLARAPNPLAGQQQPLQQQMQQPGMQQPGMQQNALTGGLGR